MDTYQRTRRRFVAPVRRTRAQAPCLRNSHSAAVRCGRRSLLASMLRMLTSANRFSRTTPYAPSWGTAWIKRQLGPRPRDSFISRHKRVTHSCRQTYLPTAQPTRWARSGRRSARNAVPTAAIKFNVTDHRAATRDSQLQFPHRRRLQCIQLLFGVIRFWLPLQLPVRTRHDKRPNSNPSQHDTDN